MKGKKSGKSSSKKNGLCPPMAPMNGNGMKFGAPPAKKAKKKR